MNKKIGKIVLIIGAFLLVIGVIFVASEKFSNSGEDKPTQEKPGDKPNEDFKDKDIEEIQTEEVTKEEINELIDAIFSDDITKSKLEEIVGTTVDGLYIYYGKDSYIRTGFTFNLKGMDEYDKKLDQYADELEKIIKDNFEVTTNEYIVSADGDIVQRLKYKSFYYVYFINDYIALRDALLNYTDLNIDQVKLGNISESDKEKIYKINVKALEIMSEHFDNYKNANEYIDYELIYKKTDTMITNDYYSLLINLSGNFYKNVSYNNSEEEKQLKVSRTQRINNYIADAISSRQLDTNDPYKLK